MRTEEADVFRAAEKAPTQPSFAREELLREQDALVREWDVWRGRRDGALRLLRERCEGIAACFPARALFRERVDEKTFLRLCRAIDSMRHACEGLNAILAEGAGLGARMRACHLSALALCRENGDASLVCSCESLWHSSAEARERLGEICTLYLPRFFEALCQKADLEANGEGCDGSAVRTLCGELQLALSRGF